MNILYITTDYYNLLTQETTWDYPEELKNTCTTKLHVDQIKLPEDQYAHEKDDDIQVPLPPNWQRFYNQDGYECKL